MEDRFKVDKYTFKEIKSTNSHRPFRVRCVETGDEKDSSISCENAATILVEQYQLAENVWDNKCKDEKYVWQVFADALLGRKKSECDEVVEQEIVGQEKIKGDIFSIASEDKYALYKEYRTEHFLVRVLFENGLMRKATKVLIEKGNEDV